eukprot:5839136-Pleurochrysis_carterae.AAC.2
MVRVHSENPGYAYPIMVVKYMKGQRLARARKSPFSAPAECDGQPDNLPSDEEFGESQSEVDGDDS